MSSMLKIALFVCITFSFSKGAEDDDIIINVRITEGGIERIFKNASNHTLTTFNDPFEQASGITLVCLSSPRRFKYALGEIAEYTEPIRHDLNIKSNITHTNFVAWGQLYPWFSSFQNNEYAQLECRVLHPVADHVVHSTPFYLGFPDEQGNIKPPVVNSQKKEIETILAFIYDHTNNNLGLGFLLFNGGTNNIAINATLINDNRLIVTSPSIAYSNEIFTASATATNLVIEAGKVGEWRLPWSSVFTQLPPTDQALLREAGDVDLVWKAGNFTSPVLPLNLKEATP